MKKNKSIQKFPDDDDDYCIGISEAGPPRNNPGDDDDPEDNTIWYPITLKNFLPFIASNMQFLVEYFANDELFNIYTTEPISIEPNTIETILIPLNITEDLKHKSILARIFYYPENTMSAKREIATLNLYLELNLYMNKIKFSYGPTPLVPSQKVAP